MVMFAPLRFCLSFWCWVMNESDHYLSYHFQSSTVEVNSLWLDLDDARKILMENGFPLPRSVVVPSSAVSRLDDYNSVISRQLAFPCVIKVISPEILHKTDVGAVKLNLMDFDSIKSAIKHLHQELSPNYRIKGYLVEEQLQNVLVEVVIGVKNDADFGHVIMVGLGGIHVEILEDVTFRLLPITKEDVLEMLEELKGRKLFEPIRGRSGINKDSLVSLILQVSDFIHRNPHILEIDLNPVGCTEKGCFILDVRIKSEISSIS